jgi:hypothetical protein
MTRRTASRAKPEELQLPRGRPPLPGSPKYAEYMRIKKQIAALRTETVAPADGLPTIRRGKPPADPDERRAWQENNELARALRDKTGISLIGSSKTPRVLTSSPVVEESKETDDEILKRCIEAFRNLHELAHSVALGDLRALMVSGGPGIGKTVTTTEVLNHHKSKNGIRYRKLAGKVTPVMLYKAAFKYRGPKDVLLIDDADGLFFTEDGLNLLKALLDTLDQREPSWNSSTVLMDDDGNDIPRSGWVYEGSVIFNSNLDFDRLTSGPASKIADHLRAVVNRCIYFDLRMHTPRELYIWTKYVVETKGILQNKKGLTKKQEQMVLTWMKENLDRMREVSIRSAMNIAFLVSKHTKNWENLAANTQFRKGPGRITFA